MSPSILGAVLMILALFLSIVGRRWRDAMMSTLGFFVGIVLFLYGKNSLECVFWIAGMFSATLALGHLLGRWLLHLSGVKVDDNYEREFRAELRTYLRFLRR